MIKRISIIIVTYNSERLIYDCLDSIFKFNDVGDGLEVIIVDNCSDNCDKMFKKIKTKYNSKVILIKSLINGGYGHGNNQGVAISRAPIVAVMNPDVRLVSAIFKKIISKFEINKEIGILGVNFVKNSNKSLYFKPEYSSLLKLIFGKYFIKWGRYKINEVFFSGSFLVFDKQSFIEIGLFDENIFMYHEEADVMNRMLNFGKLAILVDDVAVLHLAHGRTVNHYLLKVGSESRKYYFEKYNFNLKRYYNSLGFIYLVKYIGAIILNNKIKKEEFKAWLLLCLKNGNIYN